MYWMRETTSNKRRIQQTATNPANFCSFTTDRSHAIDFCSAVWNQVRSQVVGGHCRSLSWKFMWRLDKTTQEWFGECTGSAKRVAKPANCKKISKFLIFHDRSRAIDSGLLWRFLRSKWYLNATFWIGTKFLCCVCSMLIFSYLIVRSFSPQTCFLFRSTMIFLWPPLAVHATCHCHCGHGRVTDRLKIIWRFFF